MNEILTKYQFHNKDFNTFKDAYNYFIRKLRVYSKDSSYAVISDFVRAQLIANNGINGIQNFNSFYQIFPWNFERLVTLILLSEQDNQQHRKVILQNQNEFIRLLRCFESTSSLTFKCNYSIPNILGLLFYDQIKYQQNLFIKLFLYDSLFIKSYELHEAYQKKHNQTFHLTIIYLSLMVTYVNEFNSYKSSSVVISLFNKNRQIFKDSMIELSDLKKQQKCIFESWNYDYINCPMVLESKPLLVEADRTYITSVMNLVDSTFNNYVSSLTTGGGKNANIVGDAYENVFYYFFENYIHKENIARNVKNKSRELFDIVISKDDYLLGIDTKSFVITSNAHTVEKAEIALNEIVKKIIQRIKVLKDIKNTNRKFFDKKYKVDNIFSIIAVRDSCAIHKREYLDFAKNKLIEEDLTEYYDYVEKNIIVLSHYELLLFILQNVDIIDALKKMIDSGKYLDAFNPSSSNPMNDKIFEEWKDALLKEIKTLIESQSLL